MSTDKAATCLVCGKKFPRGVLDLGRHTSAITLMHLASKKPKPNFDYHCSKCDLYFKLQSHLELHLQSVCPGRLKAKATGPSSAGTHTGNNTKTNIVTKVEKEFHEPTESRDEERTMECMVCGKLFPRGPIDLARHQTAITLRHLVHPRHTATFHYGCKKCGCHFTSPEHLASHHENTTCNEDLIWPTTVMPGSRCVTRAQAVELEAAEAAGQAALKEAKAKGASSKETKKSSVTNLREEEAIPKRVAKKTASALANAAPPLSKYILNKLAAQQQQQQQQGMAMATSSGNSKRGREAPSAGAGGGGSSSGSTLVTSELYVPRTKRAKVIVPEDRQAFFAVVSLLVDPALVPESVRLCEDNFEAYVPAQHRRLVDVLKANLYCTC